MFHIFLLIQSQCEFKPNLSTCYIIVVYHDTMFSSTKVDSWRSYMNWDFFPKFFLILNSSLYLFTGKWYYKIHIKKNRCYSKFVSRFYTIIWVSSGYIYTLCPNFKYCFWNITAWLDLHTMFFCYRPRVISIPESPKYFSIYMWYGIPLVPILRRLRQEGPEFLTSEILTLKTKHNHKILVIVTYAYSFITS